MKKITKILSLGLLTLSLGLTSGCKGETTIVSELDNSTSITSKTTTQDLYNYIRENQEESVNKIFLTYLMETALNVENNATKKASYNLKLTEYFEENILNSSDYKVNGVFDEDLLVATLKEQLYDINTRDLTTSGVTFDLGLKYDYSDYINRGLNYDIYMEMLKEDYVLTERHSTLDNSKTRIVSYYSSDDLEEMEKIVEDLFDGKYANLQAVAEAKRQEELEEIGRQYCLNLGYENEYYEGTCTPSTSTSTYDSALYKFTVCENGVRCTPSEGLKYQVKLINEKEYVTEQVVNKNTTEFLYDNALAQLLREDVEDHLKLVVNTEDKFLINGLHNGSNSFNERDIILSKGPDSTYYLVTVRVVDSTSQSVEDKELAFEPLLDSIGVTSVVLHYFEDLDVEVTDPTIDEYYKNLIG